MKFWQCLLISLAILICTSCSSYEERRKIESALEQSVDRFHEQLNNEQFHEIYSRSDTSLQKRIDEATFTNQLRSAHEQLGQISGKALVSISERAWYDMGRQASFSHIVTPGSDLIAGTERFSWTIENNQPRLTAYEFRFTCRKPCSVGIEIP